MFLCMKEAREGREEEVKLGFIAHMWRWRRQRKWRQGRRGGCVCAGCWKLEDRPGRSVHFITLLSSRGPGVCRSSFCGQQSAWWLDELHLSKWMLLISTHLVIWTTSEHDDSKTRRHDGSRTVQNCLFCSANFLPFSSSHSLSTQVAALHPVHCASRCLSVPRFHFYLLHWSLSVSPRPLKCSETAQCILMCLCFSVV